MKQETTEKIGCLVFFAVILSPIFIFTINMMAMVAFGKAIEHGVPHALKMCEFAERTIGFPLRVMMTDEQRDRPWGKTCSGF